jgi:ABC-2 type transport system permease protein
MSASGSGPARGSRGALWLLIQVNTRQAWRRLLAVQEQSRLLTALIGGFMASYLALAFFLFYKGLRFAGTFPGLGQVLVERMLFLLFAFLFVLLLLSNLVISYTNLFRNRETLFLLPLPVPAQTIFQWKFIESTLLASWAFLFLVAPLLAAYGLTQDVPWHFYPLTVALLGLFLVLPAAAGAWAAVHVARRLDRRAFQVVALASVALMIAASAMWFKPEPFPEEQIETRVLVVLDRLLFKTRFAQFPWLPSYWLSAGVQQWAEGALTAAAFFALVLLSHVLFFGSLLFTRMGERFYLAASAAQSRGSVLERWGWFRAWQTRQRNLACRRGLVERCFAWLPGVAVDVRALLVKDVLVFWRDTTQWGQTLVLFGLLGVYILNLRHFTQNLTTPFWIYLVSYLNLAACSLNLATLTTRFVYLQFSLEGKRLWIVGMAPLGLPRVLLTKFALASGTSLVLTLGLIQLSCHILHLAWERTLYLSAAVVVMTFTLNGLAVGLGALYPNLKEDNPSKIVSGFGGTFCLVLSFLYILGSVVLLAMGSPWTRRGAPPPWLAASCWTGFALLSVALGWAPLKLGLRRAARFEH